jgi:dihydroorotate dehydrogenase electron transfer subunit
LTEPRTLAPPERRVATVSGVERLGAYDLITAFDRFGPRDPRPGQFYMLATASHWGGVGEDRPYLPRAFSYARAVVETDGVDLSFLLEEVGPGTERLSDLKPDEGLALVGPLGVGFRPPADGTRPVLVGGGIGAAPLLCWQDELIAGSRDAAGSGDAAGSHNATGSRDGAASPDAAAPTVLLGFRTAGHAQAAALFGPGPQVVTDDGSVGRQALVTELLAAELDGDGSATVYACGPPQMLEAVRALCAERDVPAQLAMESGMACGFGACFGCVVPTRNGYVRLCVDGPVVDADVVETALVAGSGH